MGYGSSLQLSKRILHLPLFFFVLVCVDDYSSPFSIPIFLLLRSRAKERNMATATATQTVTITYANVGVRPPVFVAGSFTDPKWQPQELGYSVESADSKVSGPLQTQYQFSRSFNISPGRWQYKFRLGLGEWWLCDENAETG